MKTSFRSLTRATFGPGFARWFTVIVVAGVWLGVHELARPIANQQARAAGDDSPAARSAKPPMRASTASAEPVSTTGPQASGDATGSQANRLILRAAHALTRHHSISARLRQRVNLFDQQMLGTGGFWQLNVGGTTYVRYEIKIPVGDQVASVQHVNDGRFLWIRQNIPMPHDPQHAQTSLKRIDVQTVVKALEAYPANSPLRDLALNAGHGGLSELMLDLYRHFNFHTAYQGTLHGVPVWITTGVARKRSASGDTVESTSTQRPDTVTVAIGRDDLFPYRVEFHKQISDSSSSRPSLVGTSTVRSILLLELFEVTLDAPLDPRGLFVYDPDEVQLVDETEEYLRQLLQSAG